MSYRKRLFPVVVALCAGAVALVVIVASVSSGSRTGATPARLSSGAALPSPDPRASLTPPSLPPLQPGEIRDTTVGSDTVPVPSGYPVAPEISATRAIEIATAGVVSTSMLSKTSPAVGLMIYSNALGADPQTAKPGVPRRIPPTLAWIVTSQGGEPLIAGPVNQPRSLPPMTCEYVAAIDAVSGKQLNAFQRCHAS